LSKDNIRILNEWQIPSFVFRYGEFFDIDYLNGLLFDESYYDIINITNKKVIHTHLGKEKKKTIFDKEVSEFDLDNYIKENVNVNSRCLVHGVSSIVKSYKPINTDILVFQKNLSDEQISNEFQKQKMRKVHEKVNELLGHLHNEKMSHRVLVGKDIQKAIQYSGIETLYCSTKMLEKILIKVPKDLQTFNIVEVVSLEKGDVGTVLEESYMGLLGITYF
jgi:hypothetical protein